MLLELRARRGLALLFITHDLSLAWTLCDRIAVMYLGRIVEQGVAVDVIERPQHPYTQALVTAVPVPTAGGGGTRELSTGELPDATDIPPGCRFHPRCPRRFEPCDRVDPALIPTGGNGQLAACLLHDPALAKRRSGGVTVARPGAGRLPAGPRNSITDVPGVLVGHAQAASGERTGVTVVAPPALPAPRGRGVDQRHRRADREARDRRAREIETPVYLCGTHAVGTVYQAAVLASGRGPTTW